MEAVSKALEKVMEEKKLARQLSINMDRYVQHPTVRKWLQNNPEWKTEHLLPFISRIKEFVVEQENCSSCEGLNRCTNMMKGHCSEMETYGNQLELTYAPCAYLKQAQWQQKQSQLINSHHIPRDIIEGTFRDFDRTDDGRNDAFTAVMNFCLHAQPGTDPVGLYLYGPLGVGKSFLMGAACNKLAERGINTFMVYTPDFFREMKGAIAEQKVDEKIQVLKDVQVLIFDDIGAENMSAWARDEILGALLQYRVMQKLPTLYTSNYSYEQLEEHFSYSHKGGIEQLKAKRIMERIKHYSDAHFVDGVNRRKR